MTVVHVVPEPALEGMRLAFVLAENRLGHYPEFREFFVRTFDLDRVGLARPGHVQALSGTIYALIFIGRSGEAFPSGVEIHAVVAALEPFDETAVDRDLWSIMRWMIDGIGGAWTTDALDATGRLFRIPASMAGDDPVS
ncbi:MAG TPA: hypothetical protein VNW90_18565 [Acetobacteraceae bacterium]|nr:hypothetical protein [Acetobacteraceae bacterium]